MESKLFETIYNNLKKRVDWCNTNLSPIKSKDDLANLTVKRYQEILNKCKSLISDMDKIYTELNHIYGMGNLTVQQQSKLVSMMRKFTKYRSDIKSLASHKDIHSLPTIPTISSYQLSILASGVLTSNGEIINVPNNVDNKVKVVDNKVDVVDNEDDTTNLLPYYYFDKVKEADRLNIKVDITDQENIQNVFKTVGLATGQKMGTEIRFRNLIFKLGEHYGINWELDTPGNVIGKIVADTEYKNNVIKRFRKLIKIGA